MVAPIEYVMVGLGSTAPTHRTAQALQALASSEIVSVQDLVFARHETGGEVSILELDDMDEAMQQVFSSVSGEYGGLLSAEDVTQAARTLPEGSACLLFVLENLWARDLFAAIEADGAHVESDLHVPAEVAERAFASISG